MQKFYNKVCYATTGNISLASLSVIEKLLQNEKTTLAVLFIHPLL